MATEDGDQDRALAVTHEVDVDGTYTMTISDSKTGELQFAWQMSRDYALDVAHNILDLYIEASYG